MTRNGKLGVCIVGCGFMGGKHAEGWEKVPEAEVVAVVDILNDRAQRMAGRFGLERTYSNYREAVVLPEVDVVSVCIPTYLHADATLAAAKAGKHVISEKPISLYTEDGQAMLQTCKENHVKLAVGFMRRHSPVLEDLHRLLADGSLGRPVMYLATDVREVRPKLEMHNIHANGGPVIDMAVHLLDQWSYIFDSEPVDVYAQGLTLAKNRPELGKIRDIAPDTASILVRFASGDIGNFVVTWGLPAGVNPPAAADQIFGPKGLAEVTFGMAHQQVRVMKQRSTAATSNTQELRILEEDGRWQIASRCDEDMYHREIASFAHSLLNDDPVAVPGEVGVAALRAARAALESLQTGRVIRLETED